MRLRLLAITLERQCMNRMAMLFKLYPQQAVREINNGFILLGELLNALTRYALS